MKRFHLWAVPLAFLLCSLSCSPPPEQETESAAPTNPLIGVWSVSTVTPGGGGETISPAQPGLFIFTEGHYSAIYSLGSDPRPRSTASFTPTAEEKIAQYDTIIVNAGTYEVTGSTITMKPMVARSPEFVGGTATADFQIAGDVLTLINQSVVDSTGAAPPQALGSMTLQRLE